MTLKIADFPTHPDVEPCPESLKVWNNQCTADAAFQWLNRPLPDDVKSDEPVCLEGVLPPLLTVEGLAKLADCELIEAQWRHGASARTADRYVDDNGNERNSYQYGVTTDNQPLYYSEHMLDVFTQPLWTVSAASDKWGIERRAIKKIINEHIDSGFVEKPWEVKQGGRVYEYYLQDDMVFFIESTGRFRHDQITNSLKKKDAA